MGDFLSVPRGTLKKLFFWKMGDFLSVPRGTLKKYFFGIIGGFNPTSKKIGLLLLQYLYFYFEFGFVAKKLITITLKI